MSGRPGASRRPGDSVEHAAWPLDRAMDLQATLGRLRGGSAPTRWLRADRALWVGSRRSGPATLGLRIVDDSVLAVAVGDGAAEALDNVPTLIGLDDHHRQLFEVHPAALARLARRRTGFRMGATGDLSGALFPAVLGQRVTAGEAHGSWTALCRDLGEGAPNDPSLNVLLGEAELPTLLVPPQPRVLARLTAHELHRYGVDRSRGDLLVGLARRAATIDALVTLPPADVRRRLMTLPGVGPWTASIATRVALGDPDAVLIGDLHLPSTVAWALAREERADDDRMLELLAPYAGNRARVQQLIKSTRIRAPRRASRYKPLPIASM